MADYKELFGSLVNKAKDVMESTGVTEVYQKGASRTKAYSRIAPTSCARSTPRSAGSTSSRPGRIPKACSLPSLPRPASSWTS